MFDGISIESLNRILIQFQSYFDWISIDFRRRGIVIRPKWPESEKYNELPSCYFSDNICPSFPRATLGWYGVFKHCSWETRTDAVLFFIYAGHRVFQKIVKASRRKMKTGVKRDWIARMMAIWRGQMRPKSENVKISSAWIRPLREGGVESSTVRV